jgi:predicted RNA binding protein YcfA (HicA-like mRNA interferase family)
MKRLDLIRKLEEQGCVFIRHGGKHDWYQNTQTKVCQTSPASSRDQGVSGQEHPQETRQLMDANASHALVP